MYPTTNGVTAKPNAKITELAGMPAFDGVLKICRTVGTRLEGRTTPTTTYRIGYPLIAYPSGRGALLFCTSHFEAFVRQQYVPEGGGGGGGRSAGVRI